MNEWFEVFKIGEHTDSAGNKKDWTEDLTILSQSTMNRTTTKPPCDRSSQSNDPLWLG